MPKKPTRRAQPTQAPSTPTFTQGLAIGLAIAVVTGLIGYQLGSANQPSAVETAEQLGSYLNQPDSDFGGITIAPKDDGSGKIPGSGL